MNERIREVRKLLGLTLEKFGERLGVGKTAISKIEKGERGVTDQMAKSICREFNVDPYWLETGDGEMFIETDDAFFAKIDQIMAGESEFHRNLMRVMANLDMEELRTIERMVNEFSELKNKKENRE